MNVKQILAIMIAMLGLLVCFEAQAFYNPDTGRWLSRDPIGERGGRSLYVFVNNNVPLRIDPLGLFIYEPPPVPPTIPSDTKIERCNRKIKADGATGWDACIIGCANIRGHDFYRFGDQGIGFTDENGKDGDLPRPEDEEDVKTPRRCYSCYRTGKLNYGMGSGKSAEHASDEEVFDCLKNVPIKGDYGGIRNNCNVWADRAAKECGLKCGWNITK